MQNIIKLTNKYIVVATPLILFTLLISVYISISAANARALNLIFALFLSTIMMVAFVAGWFNMIKKASLDSEPNDPNAILKDFVSGVGEYFLPAIGAMVVVIVLNILMAGLSYFIGSSLIGNPDIDIHALSKAVSSTEALKAYLTTLSTEQLIKINMWNILILGVMSITCFLLIFYIPALFFKTKNPFSAFFISLKDLFSKKIIKNAGIYILLFTLNFFISIFSALFAGNVFMNFIMTLINFYFISAASIGVFYYYNNNFVANKIGRNIDLEI